MDAKHRRDRTLTFDDDVAGIFTEAAHAKVAEVTQAIVTDLFHGVQKLTPVKTGRLRDGWEVGIGAPMGEEGQMDSEGIIKEIDGTQPVYVSNCVPYVMLIEFGGAGNSSKSAKSRTPREGRHMLTIATLETSGRLEQIVASTL